MVSEPEDGRAAVGLVATKAFEDAGAVVERVRQNVDGRILPATSCPFIQTLSTGSIGMPLPPLRRWPEKPFEETTRPTRPSVRL